MKPDIATPFRITLAKVTCTIERSDAIEVVVGGNGTKSPYVTLLLTMQDPDPDDNGLAQRHVVLRSQDITTLIKALHQAHEHIS